MTNLFLYHLEICLPLFLLVSIGWVLKKMDFFSLQTYHGLATFTFRFLMPAMLFHLMSQLSELPPVNWKTILVFGLSCVIVFCIGRGWGNLFKLDNTGKTVFAIAAIFGNNVQLGVPIVQVSLGNEAIPTLSALVIFSVLTMWTSAIAFVELGQNDRIKNSRQVLHSLLRVFKNPIVLGILSGSGVSLIGIRLPHFADQTLLLISSATTPIALMVVGMGLAQYRFTAGLRKGLSITTLKIAIQPLLVFLLARLFDLNNIETYTVTLTAALPVAINVFLMASDFKSEEDTVSNAIFTSTLLSAVAIPITLTLMGVH